MNPQVANRSWLGAIASTIKAFCALFISAMSVTQEAVAIGDKAIKTARLKHAIDSNMVMRTYTSEAKAAAQLRQVASQVKLDEFVAADPSGRRKQLVDEIGKNLDLAIREALVECGQLPAEAK